MTLQETFENATKLPLSVEKTVLPSIKIVAPDKTTVALILSHSNKREYDCTLLVHCFNNFQGIVAALENLVHTVESGDCAAEQARAIRYAKQWLSSVNLM